MQVNVLMLPTTETVNVDLSVKSTLFFRLGQFFGFVPQQVSIDYFPFRTRRSLPKTPLKPVKNTLKIHFSPYLKPISQNMLKTVFKNSLNIQNSVGFGKGRCSTLKIRSCDFIKHVDNKYFFSVILKCY